MRSACRLAALIILGLSSSAQAQVIACPPFDTVNFYVLYNTSNGVLSVDDEYVGWSPDGRNRVVHMASALDGNLFAVCSSARTAFEASQHVTRGLNIDGELWEARSTTNGARLGTVWIDTTNPKAGGGSISLQKFYQCKPAGSPEGVIVNVGAFGTLFDSTAINASAAMKSANFTTPVNKIIGELVVAHMSRADVATCGAELTKDGFVQAYWSTGWVFYLNLDPVIGEGLIPPGG